jgi:hypothetical protein
LGQLVPWQLKLGWSAKKIVSTFSTNHHPRSQFPSFFGGFSVAQPSEREFEASGFQPLIKGNYRTDWGKESQIPGEKKAGTKLQSIFDKKIS